MAGDSPVAVGWGFVVLWVLASAAGWGIGGPAIVTATSSQNIIVKGYLGVTGGVVLASLLQWPLLRIHVARVGLWVPAGIATAAVVGVVTFGVGAFNAGVGWVGGAGLLGTVLGVLQWMILRGQVSGAAWWVLASTVGWIAGGPGIGIVGATAGAAAAAALGLPADPAVSWTALGAVYGAITGVVLVRLLRARAPLSATQGYAVE